MVQKGEAWEDNAEQEVNGFHREKKNGLTLPLSLSSIWVLSRFGLCEEYMKKMRAWDFKDSKWDKEAEKGFVFTAKQTA